jgi:hypothetical protein
VTVEPLTIVAGRDRLTVGVDGKELTMSFRGDGGWMDGYVIVATDDARRLRDWLSAYLATKESR